MTIEALGLAIFGVLVKQLGPEVVSMILDVLDGNGGKIESELQQMGMRVLADLQLAVSTTEMREQLVAMETAVDAAVDIAEEAKLAAEGQK